MFYISLNVTTAQKYLVEAKNKKDLDQTTTGTPLTTEKDERGEKTNE